MNFANRRLPRPSRAGPATPMPMPITCAGTLVVLLALWLAGCTSMTSYRGLQHPTPDCSKAQRYDFLDPCRGATTETVPATDGAAGYTLHFAEFDDQGWVFKPPRTPASEPGKPSDNMGQPDRQIDTILAQLKGALAPAQRVRLFVYVHGWRHSAAVDDTDVADFRKFLLTQAGRVGERNRQGDPAQAEQVVGIYVGWRGQSVDDLAHVVPLSLVSFWDRKRAAERVAQGSIRELFARLLALKREVDRDRDALMRSKTAAALPESRLRTTIIGHSFGAAIVFRSVSQALIASFADDLDDGVERIADYLDSVVLINPAIEAARFEPLLRVAASRAERCRAKPPQADPALCVRPAYTRPLLAIYTSEGDWATHWAFWLGAKAGNLLQRVATEQQQEANDNAVGWVHRLVTHELRLLPEGCGDGPVPGLSEQIAPTAGSAGRRYAAPGWSACVPLPAAKPPAQGARLRHCDPALPDDDPRACSMGKRYGPLVEPYDYNGPLWNVRVDKALIGGHSDNWNPRFMAVLHQVLFD